MNVVRLAGETDFAGWRSAARRLLALQIPPADIEWIVGEADTLFEDASAPRDADSSREFRVPAKFIALCRDVIMHRDPQRFALLYRLLWRLREESRLLDIEVDEDVARARTMQKAIDRDIHKMHAYVRFREVAAVEGPVYVAWFEPAHYIVEAAAPFFMRRFAAMRWSILTPHRSAFWDGEKLRFGPGAKQSDAPDSDALEALWKTYYASIFNPARLKIHTMQGHMPRKYWANLPEAALIPQLIGDASRRTLDMIDAAASTPRHRTVRYEGPAPAPAGTDTLAATRASAAKCRACPLWEHATQTVFGEGPDHASVVFVGEQPGDREDLTGRPFVGPAGALFDRALAAAGIARDAVYVTNAVKHFKFTARGKRRLHRTPGQLEVDACHEWLERELALVQPRLVVALGATATRALTRVDATISSLRGRIMPWQDDMQLLVTVHPAAILRTSADSQDAEYQRFAADIALAAPFVSVSVSAPAP